MIILFKILCTLYVCLIVWKYWKAYGPQNFLWMSDIGLFISLAALWLESPLLVSMCISAFLVSEVMWNIDFFFTLITGHTITGISGYMFDAQQYSLFLRLLSLFHVVLPAYWIGSAIYWGYDPCALLYAIPMIWIILLFTYFFTDPASNINWMFMPQERNWKQISSIAWLGIMLIGYPLLICLPTHMLFKQVFHHVEKASCS